MPTGHPSHSASRRSGSAATTRETLHLPGLARTIQLTDAKPVADALGLVLRGWQPSSGRQAFSATRVWKTARGYDLASDYLDAPMRELPVASAVCAIIADISQAWVDERPGHMALHCGAFETGAGLVAITGPARSGKSTLIARLGLETSVRVFCDDVLAVTPDAEGVALGMPPRLRLPLPGALGPAMVEMASSHSVLHDDRYAYVATPNLVPHGTHAPLQAMVLLDRRPGATARLHALSAAEAVRVMMMQEISTSAREPEGFDRMLGLVDRLTCLRLVHDGLEAATALLLQAFAAPGPVAGRVQVAPPLPVAADGAAVADPLPPSALATPWARAPLAVPRRMRGELVIWTPGQAGGVVLNETGAAVWRLLEEPLSGSEIVLILAGAFPDVPRPRITADVAALLGALAAGGWITKAGGA